MLLKKLKNKGYTLAIGSTTKRRNMNIYMNKNTNIKNKANIEDIFSLILLKEDVKEIKPNPEVYQKIMQELKVSAKQCLIFEDSLIGVEAAKRAGIDVAVIYDKYSEQDKEKLIEMADYYFNDYSEVLAKIKENYYER